MNFFKFLTLNYDFVFLGRPKAGRDLLVTNIHFLTESLLQLQGYICNKFSVIWDKNGHTMKSKIQARLQ